MILVKILSGDDSCQNPDGDDGDDDDWTSRAMESSHVWEGDMMPLEEQLEVQSLGKLLVFKFYKKVVAPVF